MVAPVRGHIGRHQAQNPLTQLSEFPGPALFGLGASPCGTACSVRAASRFTEVTATTVLAGHHRFAVRACKLLIGWFDHAVFSLLHSNVVPSTQMQCKTRASLRATATWAFFMPTRLASRSPQAFHAHHFLVRCISTLAASYK
jgi:hypothetical protein